MVKDAKRRGQLTLAALRSVLLVQGFGILEGTGIKGFLVYLSAGPKPQFIMQRLNELEQTMKGVERLCRLSFVCKADPVVHDWPDKYFLLNVMSAV